MDRLLGDCVLAVAVLLSVVTQVRPPRVNFHQSVAIEMMNAVVMYEVFITYQINTF